MTATVALGWLGVGALPAFGHAVFQPVTTVAPDADTAVTLSVPHERDENTYNVKVVVALPSGWASPGCEQKDTWTCAVEQVDDAATVTWVKADGAARAEDETFVFTLHAPATPGLQAAFPAQQVYNTGETVAWSGPPGSAGPAPLLATEAAPSAAPSPEPTPVPTAAPAPGTPTATAAPAGVELDTTSTAASEDAGGGGFPAAAGVVALALSGTAAVFGTLYGRKRRAGA